MNRTTFRYFIPNVFKTSNSHRSASITSRWLIRNLFQRRTRGCKNFRRSLNSLRDRKHACSEYLLLQRWMQKQRVLTAESYKHGAFSQYLHTGFSFKFHLCPSYQLHVCLRIFAMHKSFTGSVTRTHRWSDREARDRRWNVWKEESPGHVGISA